jgi:CheY-like chemotaxis protein
VQVIGNLLQNAAKFTPRGGAVTITVQMDTSLGQAILAVGDTGCGLRPEALPSIFQAFAQVDTTLDRARGGLGLGLSVVKGLIELHGGTVGAESDGPGKGATFTLRLPLAEPVCVAAPGRREEAVAGRGRRVLIIEDNQDAADSLREMLELGAHTVEVAYRGPEGIAKARAFAPDLVLCDIGLPGMDGYAVAQALRADAALAHVFLAALTGYVQPEDVARAQAAGFDLHLAKPPSSEALERALGEARRAG